MALEDGGDQLVFGGHGGRTAVVVGEEARAFDELPTPRAHRDSCLDMCGLVLAWYATHRA